MVPGGDAEVALRVLRFSTGSWMEDQDMWRLSGVTRESFVYVHALVLLSPFLIQCTMRLNVDDLVFIS